MKKGKDDCFRESIKIISLRQYSVCEVKEKLVKRGFATNSVNESINKLLEYRYLNDRDLTRAIISNKFHSNGYGRRRIREYLRRRKIPEDIIREELEISVSRESSIIRGVKVLEKKLKRAKDDRLNDRARMMRFLAGRGFDLDECVNIISEYEKMIRVEDEGERR